MRAGFVRGLGLASVVVVATACHRGSPPRSGSDDPQDGAVVHFTVDSALVGRRLEQAAIRLPPLRHGRRPLLVLLHGRGGAPDAWISEVLLAALRDAGAAAPDVVMVNGGEASYYHDRVDGEWGSYVVQEVIPQAVRILGADPHRVAIGGSSMGGFGALDIARLHPGRFCAVGGHAPAIFDSAGRTSEGSFDDAEDFARHDLVSWARTEAHPYPGAEVWIDVGTEDPFHDAAVEVARDLERHGADVTLKVLGGGHGGGYITEHLATYVSFYAKALRRC